MNKLKKLGLPADIAPSLDILRRVANGEDLEYDIAKVVKDIALAQYYLRGKKEGMNIKEENKKDAQLMITDTRQTLKELLTIVTDT